MWKRALFVCVLAVGCAAPAAAQYIPPPPPPRVVEEVPAPRSDWYWVPGHYDRWRDDWVPGHYEGRHHRWEWESGRWVGREREDCRWVESHRESSGRWEPGHWR